MGSYGNLFQGRQNFTWIRSKHTWKAGAEVRLNIDTTVFGTSPNGTYKFGGGNAYATTAIRSQSGRHDIAAGDPLPDALTGFLTATPFSYNITAAPPLFSQGSRIGIAAIRRQAYNFFVQDNWKISSNLVINYGLRYEVSSSITEAKNRASDLFLYNSAGVRIDPMNVGGGSLHFLINPRPTFPIDWDGWGPRLSLDWRLNDKTLVRAGASITTLLVNLWQQNFVTGGLPFTVNPYAIAQPGKPVPFSNTVQRVQLPEIYSTSGEPIFRTGRTTDVPPNTEMDVLRFERDLAALSPDKQIHAISAQGIGPDLHNGYVGSWTAGLERSFGDITATAAYVATAGIRLACVDSPNGYPGASPEFAPFTLFDAQGRVQGGYGPVWVSASHSHSTYHSLQTSVGKNSLRAGLGFQASYTFSKSIDDTSAVLGGFLGSSSGAVLQTSPQDPRNRKGEKGPSTFDITHAFSFSAIQELRLDRTALLHLLGRRFTAGWQLLGMGSLATGAPFTIFSGIQETAVGSNGADRPDQVGTPVLSTSRTVREDYFGRGTENPSYFAIPIGIPGGTGPNRGRFGTLGRNTFRGPGFHNFDFSLIKDTPVGTGLNPERVVLQFRAEVFNAFNIVNFGLPANIVLGPGFGMINRTAGPSRQIQLSLKVLY
jgi:hypothetical protein